MPNLIINSKYAGGNIHVVSIDEPVVKVEQEMRDTEGWWFYWNFRVESVKAQTVTFEFQNGEVIGPWGPAVSTDGIRWDWLGADSVTTAHSFQYEFGDAEIVYFCFSLPYQLHHFESFYSRISNHSLVTRKLFTYSEQLRPVPLLLIGNPFADQHIIMTSRHHACESPPSYLLEGLLEHYLAQTESSFLKHFLIHFIPFVDIDGVENGDQGKSRAPHDHNRDYILNPIYNSTKAIADYVKLHDLAVGIDFHSPFKWGGRNDTPFIVKKASPRKEENERFGRLLQSMTSHRAGSGDITYDPVHDIEMGEDWNQPHGTNCSAYFERQNMKLVFTFEFPYFGKDSMIFTPDKCRLFGTDFAQALEAYLVQKE
ncbi:MAG: hypothetical protein K0R67_187 [Paenibacillus sp.]|nr:hypothetical protein [Paenibacillus sp.]